MDLTFGLYQDPFNKVGFNNRVKCFCLPLLSPSLAYLARLFYYPTAMPNALLAIYIAKARLEDGQLMAHLFGIFWGSVKLSLAIGLKLDEGR